MHIDLEKSFDDEKEAALAFADCLQSKVKIEIELKKLRSNLMEARGRKEMYYQELLSQ